MPKACPPKLVLAPPGEGTPMCTSVQKGGTLHSLSPTSSNVLPTSCFLCSSNLNHFFFSLTNTPDAMLLDPRYFLHTLCTHLLVCISASGPTAIVNVPKHSLTMTFLWLKSAVTGQDTAPRALPAVTIRTSGHVPGLSLGHTCSSRVFAQALLVLAHQWNYSRFRLLKSLLDTSSLPPKAKLTLLSSCLCISSTQNKFPADWFSMNLKFQGLCQLFGQWVLIKFLITLLM